MAGIIVTEWQPLHRNTLRGFLTATMPSGVVLHEVAIHVSENKPWASPPSKPMIDRDGVALKNPAGKMRYSPVVSFTDKITRDRWSAAVIAALIAAHPDVLDGAA
jgi:hypothetical protein